MTPIGDGGEVGSEPAMNASRMGRSPNSLAFQPERSRPSPALAPSDRPQVGEPGGPSHRPGDVPPSLARRYFTEGLRAGAGVAFFEGPGAKRIAFKDHGARLETDQTHPALVRDLAAIAVHRGWRGVRVRGEDDFRRDMWMEARALGLEVKGYRPRDRDIQELERRMQAARAPTPRRDVAWASTQKPFIAPTLDRDTRRPASLDAKPIAGTLLEAGEAPYRRRTGAPLTPFLRIDRGNGRLLDVWGAGLLQALARSGAQIGDAVQVRRDGLDVVQRPLSPRADQTIGKDRQARPPPRVRWAVEAERFRKSSAEEAARDKDLSAAQSHLRVLGSAIDAAVHDPGRRARLQAEARGLIADEIAQGRRFTAARVRQIEPVTERDRAAARADPVERRTSR